MEKRVLLMFVFIMAFAFADTDGVITVKSVIELISKNIQLQISTKKYQIAEAQTNQAWSTIFPKLALSGGVNRMDSYSARVAAQSFAGFGGLLANVPSVNWAALSALSSSSGTVSDYYSAKVQLTQILYSQAVFSAIEASSFGLESARYEMENTKEDVYNNVIKLYLAIIQLEKQLENMRESKEQMDKLLDKVQNLKRNGLATQIDVLRTKSGLSSLKAGIIGMANSLYSMYGNLEMIVNTKLENIKLDNSIIEVIYKDKIDTSYDLQSVLKNRNDYNQMQSALQLLKANISMQESNGLPSVAAVGSYGYQSATGFNFTDTNRDWMYGVNVNWNVFDAGTTQAKVSEARDNYEILAKQLEQICLVVGNDLANDVASIKATKAKVDATLEELEVSMEAYNLMDSRYTLGEVTNLELIDNYNQLLSAKNKLVYAKIEYVLAVIKWYKDKGKLGEYINKGV